jgi:hypothetical protein
VIEVLFTVRIPESTDDGLSVLAAMMASVSVQPVVR